MDNLLIKWKSPRVSDNISNDVENKMLSFINNYKFDKKSPDVDYESFSNEHILFFINFFGYYNTPPIKNEVCDELLMFWDDNSIYTKGSMHNIYDYYYGRVNNEIEYVIVGCVLIEILESNAMPPRTRIGGEFGSIPKPDESMTYKVISKKWIYKDINSDKILGEAGSLASIKKKAKQQILI